MDRPQSEQRIIIEMGMGNDLHGMDYTKAAGRAIEDAFRHSSLPIFGVTGISHDQMRVQVTVGVQEPDKVDTNALAAFLPRGQASVTAVLGGLNVTDPGKADVIVVATAAVEAFLPNQAAKWKLKG